MSVVDDLTVWFAHAFEKTSSYFSLLWWETATFDDATLAVTKSQEALWLWFRIVATVGIWLAQNLWAFLRALGIILWPYIKQSLIYLRDSDPVTKYVLIGCTVIVLVLWLLKREIARRKIVSRLYKWSKRSKKKVLRPYHAVQEKIFHQSKIMGLLLPHLIYGSTVTMLLYFLPAPVELVAQSWIVYAIIVFYPIVASTRAVRDGDLKGINFWLELWVVIGFWMTLLQLPFVVNILSLLPKYDEIRMIVFIWLLLPATNGAQGSYIYVKRFLHKRLPSLFGELPAVVPGINNRGRAAEPRGEVQRNDREEGDGSDDSEVEEKKGEEVEERKHAVGAVAAPEANGVAGGDANEVLRDVEIRNPTVNMIIGLLVGMKVISDDRARRLFAMISNGIIQVLISLMFIFTVGAVTRVGCVIVGICYPMYATVKALNTKVQTKTWLTYWSAYMMSALVFTSWEFILSYIPFIYQGMLVYTLYLQLPVFCGAEKVYIIVEKHLTHAERFIMSQFQKLKQN